MARPLSGFTKPKDVVQLKFLIVSFLALFAGFLTLALGVQSSLKGAETIYIVNHAGRYISNQEIRHDIPAWEQAANQDFDPVWGAPQVKIKLVKVAPRGSISALFVKNGPIQGALAYHTTINGTPKIVVYAGTADYYGYSNSVSFTHELFETLADPFVSALNQGLPVQNIAVQGGHSYPFPADSYWIQEVCDPVEANVYAVNGVPISDFITPNFFNDGATGGFDYLGVLNQPYEIAKGGYAVFEVEGQFNAVTNFRHAGPDASGFLKGESAKALERSGDAS